MLLDLKTGERLWALADKDRSKSTYAIHSGFGALSRDASVAAFADHTGSVYLVDRAGKVLVSEKITEEAHDAGAHNGPPDGVGVWLSDTGKTAVFGFRRQLVIVSADRIERLKIEGLTSAAISADGALVVAGCGDGKVRAFDPAGKQVWEATPRRRSARGRGGSEGLPRGDRRWRPGAARPRREGGPAHAVGREPDKETHELKPAADVVRSMPPIDYVEPPTLALAPSSWARRRSKPGSPAAPASRRLADRSTSWKARRTCPPELVRASSSFTSSIGDRRPTSRCAS